MSSTIHPGSAVGDSRMLSPAGLWLQGGEPRPGHVARAWLRSRDDVLAIERYTPEQLLPGPTIYDCIKASATAHPHKPALTELRSANVEDAPRVIRYDELLQRIEQAANLFRELAVGDRPVVAVVLPMLSEGLVATWAGATAGIACPVNPFLEPRVAASIMNAANANVLVTTTDRHGPGLWDRLDELRALVPTLKHVLVVDSEDPADDFLSSLRSRPHGRLTFEAERDPNALAIYLPTGGTTAAPKLVPMTHRGKLLNAWITGALCGSEVDGVVGHAMPNFHNGGLTVLALRAMLFGQTLLTLTAQGFRNRHVIQNFWEIAKHHRMTSLLATPATASAILAIPDATSAGHSIHTFSCGASTVPVEMMRAFHGRFGIWLSEIWGLSETYGCTTGHPNDGREPRIGSVGMRLPFMDVKVVELDGDNRHVRECAAGERGILAVAGNIVNGYVDDRLNRDFLVQGMPDGRRWANTGDLGAIDEQGYTWLYGRSKDLIIRGGHNIDPKTIEEVLAGHPAVELCAAVGRPDAERGEMPVAYVQLIPSMRASAAEILQFCRERVQERAAVPVEIIIVPEIPISAVGKIAKPALRNDITRRLAYDVALQVIGDAGTARLGTDESGLRPTVTIDVELTSGDAVSVAAELEKAFARYEFATRVVVSTSKAT